MTDTGTMPDHKQGKNTVGTQKRLRTVDVEVQTLYTGSIVSVFCIRKTHQTVNLSKIRILIKMGQVIDC